MDDKLKNFIYGDKLEEIKSFLNQNKSFDINKFVFTKITF
jgi:hypothetical protein